MFEKKSFGLDISDFSVEAMELKKALGKFKIKSYSRIKLGPQIVENGAILNMSKLAKNIGEMLAAAQPNAIKTKNVSLSLPESKVFTSIVNLPSGLKDEEIAEAVDNQIPEIFPVNVEDTISSWQVLDATDKEQEVLVAVVEKNLLKQYFTLAEKLDLKIISLEMESISAARSILPQVKNNEGTLLLDMGARTTSISIFDARGLYSTYNIDVAGQSFTDEIAKKLKISATEAEKRKIKSGLKAPAQGEILLVVQSLLQKIIPEIKKSINYFEEKTGKNINTCYVSGGSALLPGMVEYLAQNLQTKVELGKPFTKITNSDIISEKKQEVLFSNVCGLAAKTLEKSKKKIINFI